MEENKEKINKINAHLEVQKKDWDKLIYGCNTTRIGNPTLWSPQTAKGSDDAGHSMQGIFIVADSSTNKKGYIGEVDILDVAPTILHKLRIEIPQDIKGKVINP